MELKNPYTQYPKYAVNFILKDGRMGGKSGVCTPKIELPFEEKDLALIVMSAFNNRSEEQAVSMYRDGVWKAYDEKVFHMLQKSKAKRKRKPMPKGPIFDVTSSEDRGVPFVLPDLVEAEANIKLDKKGKKTPVDLEADFKLNKKGEKTPVDLEEDEKNEWGLGCI